MDRVPVPRYNAACAQTLARLSRRFDYIKSETLNLRVSPSFKLALKAAANAERRSMVNMLEVLLTDYCEDKGIDPALPRKTAHSLKSYSHMKAAP